MFNSHFFAFWENWIEFNILIKLPLKKQNIHYWEKKNKKETDYACLCILLSKVYPERQTKLDFLKNSPQVCCCPQWDISYSHLVLRIWPLSASKTTGHHWGCLAMQVIKFIERIFFKFHLIVFLFSFKEPVSSYIYTFSKKIIWSFI